MSDLTALPGPYNTQLELSSLGRASALLPAPPVKSFADHVSYAPYQHMPRPKSRKQLREPHPGNRVVLEQPRSPSLAGPEYHTPAAQPNAIRSISNPYNFFLDRWQSFLGNLSTDDGVTNVVLDQMTVLIVARMTSITLTPSHSIATSHLGDIFYGLEDKLLHEYCPEPKVIELLHRMLPASHGQQSQVDASMVHFFTDWVGIYRTTAMTPDEFCHFLSSTRLRNLDSMRAVMYDMCHSGFASILCDWLLPLTEFPSSNTGCRQDHVSGTSLAKTSSYPGSRADGHSGTVPTSTNTLDTGSKAEYSRFSISPGTGKWNLWKRCFK